MWVEPRTISRQGEPSIRASVERAKEAPIEAGWIMIRRYESTRWRLTLSAPTRLRTSKVPRTELSAVIMRLDEWSSLSTFDEVLKSLDELVFRRSPTCRIDVVLTIADSIFQHGVCIPS